MNKDQFIAALNGEIDTASYDFRYTDLSGVDFSLIEWPFAVIDFRGANLSNTVFYKVFLQIPQIDNAKCRNAKFLNCILYGADFSNSDLRDADFTYSKLLGCEFRGSNLTGTVFDGCTLSGSNFSNATMTNASLAGAKLDGVVGLDNIEGFDTVDVTATIFDVDVLDPSTD
jgi:uncharacterized protein YjbI with pentapeptide repeats